MTDQPRRPGRPKLLAGFRRRKLTVTINNDARARIEAQARAAGLSLSAVVEALAQTLPPVVEPAPT